MRLKRKIEKKNEKYCTSIESLHITADVFQSMYFCTKYLIFIKQLQMQHNVPFEPLYPLQNITFYTHRKGHIGNPLKLRRE